MASRLLSVCFGSRQGRSSINPFAAQLIFYLMISLYPCFLLLENFVKVGKGCGALSSIEGEE